MQLIFVWRIHYRRAKMNNGTVSACPSPSLYPSLYPLSLHIEKKINKQKTIKNNSILSRLNKMYFPNFHAHNKLNANRFEVCLFVKKRNQNNFKRIKIKKNIDFEHSFCSVCFFFFSSYKVFGSHHRVTTSIVSISSVCKLNIVCTTVYYHLNAI